MATTPPYGVPVVEDGVLVSTNPASGAEVGRFPVADSDAVASAVLRARAAAAWWSGLGFTGRRERLSRWGSLLAHRMGELAALVHKEGGKPVGDAILEIACAIDHVAWAARNARRVLGPRRVRGNLLTPEYAGHLEYQPYGVIGVIGPWNYPVLTPLGSIAYALAAGNTVVYKPSEYTPAVGQWLVDSFAEAVGVRDVLTCVHGLGETGAALCESGVDKIAFTGSTATAKRVMATCARSLTPVVLECGGNDALIVDSDADLEAAADAAVWGGMSNAGQTCIGIERVYVVQEVADQFLAKLVEKASALTVGTDPDADIGPITMPAQLEIISRHITDAVERGARAVLGGVDAVRPPLAYPTVLVDPPADAAVLREETFGPVLPVIRVADAEEALRLANDTSYGLGGAVFGRSRAMDLARRMRTGMVSVNSVLSFVTLPRLPFGGVGDSGFGRIHGDDGLREFARSKAIARRRAPSPVPLLTFRRTPFGEQVVRGLIKLMHGRHGR